MKSSARVREQYGLLLAAVLLVCLSLTFHPATETAADYLGYALRVTAWITFLFFILAYVARPVQQLFGGFQFFVRNRRYLGLGAAFSHTVHFGYVIANTRITEAQVDLVTWIFGGLAFVLFWLMALTSNRVSVRTLGAWWRRLHLFGMHYIWFIFTITFAGGLGVNWISTLLFVDCILALGLRMAAAWQRKRMVTA